MLKGVEKYRNYQFVQKPTSKQLEEVYGFRYEGISDGTKYHILQFPVEYCITKTNKKIVSLLGQITVNSDDNFVQIDVIQPSGMKHTFYPDFYNQEYGNPEPRLGNVCKAIEKKCKQLGIAEDKGHDKRRTKGSRISKRRNRQTDQEVL